MSTTPDPLAPVLIAWQRWDDEPGSRTRVLALHDAIHALVGAEQRTPFIAHVQAARRAGATLVEAVHSWQS
jgi:hypothetical protein